MKVGYAEDGMQCPAHDARSTACAAGPSTDHDAWHDSWNATYKDIGVNVLHGCSESNLSLMNVPMFPVIIHEVNGL